MRIRILDRRTLEAVARKPFDQKTMLISISDFKKPFPCVENMPEYCLFLQFDDLYVPESWTVIYETDSSDFSRHFSWFQAQRIAGFVKEYLHEAGDIICQCEYGVSRSAAVAAAILEYAEGRGEDIFNDLKYHPNQGVYTMTLAALEEDDMRNPPKLNTKQRPLPYNIFSGENFKEDLWITPYQPGDLLYINCRPYRRPEFCLVYYVSKNASTDSGSLTSVYPTFGGLIEKRTINGDRVFVLEREYFRDCYISPLYRAEVYRSELPETCKFMEPVIKALKKKPEMGEYIDIFVGYGKEYQIDPKEDVKMFGISEKQWNIIVDFCNKNVDNDSDVTI